MQILSLWGWNFAGSMTAAGTTHCDSGCDVTIATHLCPDLYFPKWKMPYFVAPESNRLSCACAVWCPCLLTPIERTTRANNTFWRRETLILPFEWRGPRAHFVANWKCHSGHMIELSDECNNCTKFQFYKEKVFRDIHFLWFYIIVTSHSSNLHKSSWITRQPRMLLQ